MKTLLLVLLSSLLFPGLHAADIFARPERGFVSDKPASNWQEGLLTGNGTVGAIVPGAPFDETLYLSHAGLYLPNDVNPRYIEMAPALGELRRLCFAGNYRAVCDYINIARAKTDYADARDPFMAAFTLHIRQPEAPIRRYQRKLNWLTAEASVSVAETGGEFERSVFASRADGILVVRLKGSGRLSARFTFAPLPTANPQEKAIVAAGIKDSFCGVRNGLLYFRSDFARANPYNPFGGYEGFGKVIARGGERSERNGGVEIKDADEILVLVKIVPLNKTRGGASALAATATELDSLGANYDHLLARHERLHGALMQRVSFSLDAPREDRLKSTERLSQDSLGEDAPLAKIERAFDAGRYNIICSTGYNPPNLMGLWSATWLAPWAGSFTTDGNLPCAVSFDLLGNTPELLQPFFRYFDARWDGFRRNAKAFFGTRGFHVPGQLTVSPLETDFNPRWPLCYWNAGAAWILQYYFDYYEYTGDRQFLETRVYPLLREQAAFYQDFLTVTDKTGHVVFVPSYSPENAPVNEDLSPAVTINATMDVAAARQLLGHAVETARLLGKDPERQHQWESLLSKLPPYEVGPDGSFREWLWPGLVEANHHRHASQLYALFDGMPEDIVGHPALVKAVEHTIRERLAFRKNTSGDMAFGLVQLGLAAEHIQNSELAEHIINQLVKHYWATGMASFHNVGDLFNMDISGGFPYLCASALVYSDPGLVRFFPARPARWRTGKVRGLRLRGGILLEELTWSGQTAHAVLKADIAQKISVEYPGGTRTLSLPAGNAVSVDF